jgi:hypothetical protein
MPDGCVVSELRWNILDLNAYFFRSYGGNCHFTHGFADEKTNWEFHWNSEMK